ASPLAAYPQEVTRTSAMLVRALALRGGLSISARTPMPLVVHAAHPTLPCCSGPAAVAMSHHYRVELLFQTLISSVLRSVVARSSHCRAEPHAQILAAGMVREDFPSCPPRSLRSSPLSKTPRASAHASVDLGSNRRRIDFQMTSSKAA